MLKTWSENFWQPMFFYISKNNIIIFI
uniref:Uncharacterized protein n=1 Tax=Anguilla anguilla TaxID=7936 RepID=A0A0E9SIM5_ANGAN